MQSTFRAAADAATSTARGSFLWDQDSGGYSEEWDSKTDFLEWLEDEQRSLVVEYRLVKTESSAGVLWTTKETYVCSRQGTGGISKYEKKHPDRERKIESKRTGCSSTIIVKTYPHTTMLLSRYMTQHAHGLHKDNIKYTRLSDKARARIAKMLRAGIPPREIVRHRSDLLLQRQRFRADRESGILDRDSFVKMTDIRRIERLVEAETIRLDQDDGRSCLRWADKLHSVPVAWCIASNGTQETVDFFIGCIQDLSPDVWPLNWMTDRDLAQINVIKLRYPKSRLFLCWWHVLHAWQAHFNTTAFPELWALLKRWIRISNPAEFDLCWTEIKTLPHRPKSVIAYLEHDWIPWVHAWSAVARQGRTIYEESDTNMYLEGYQMVGFEGPDLKARHINEIKKRARTIPSSHIKLLPDGSSLVQSQTKPDIWYIVDPSQHTCTCPDFPRVTYCKHLHAVHPTPESTPDYSSRLPEDLQRRIGKQSVDSVIADLVDLVSDLGNIAPELRALHPAAQALKTIRAEMRRVLAMCETDLEAEKTTVGLPDKRVIGPNQHGWSQTTEVMLGNKKGKKRRQHTDPYAGGERSGKRAKADAHAKSNDQSRYVACVILFECVNRAVAAPRRPLCQEY
ncbi:hypothetical protein FA95DRAFT_1492871 [Auriscalpium vulgare]|uniref:Uncharacterized protein n=1 Tax=Auriscalpium vulgare TaxID=40419 RepID=A0ACB8RUB8_9AGAM|nr:hypothetical protein FA95DRAFT_1492871 [Auriscalpium vulgare]